jgi:F-type H+-transporting ATPase subunit b
MAATPTASLPLEEAAEHAAENLHAPDQPGVTETHAATGAEHGSGGLPQFEFQHWGGQVAYLLILFAILYILVAKVFWPRMRRVTDERASTISGAVAAARQVQAEAAQQAEAAKAEVEAARASSRATAAAAKARVTEQANARAAAEEAVVNARIAEAETAIGQTRDAAMANVSAIAADTAAAIVERLTGKAPTAAEAAAAKGAA